MTGKEMMAEFLTDKILMKRKLDALTEGWRKIIKKFPRTRIRVDTYRCKESCQDYLIIHLHENASMKRGVIRKCFAIVKDDRQTLYISSSLEGHVADVFSSHFFNRYRERIGLGDMPIDRVVAEFLFRCNFQCSVYNDYAGHIVYANMDGICLCDYEQELRRVNLCDYEQETNRINYRTFVSNNMLHLSQFKAWNIVQDKIAELSEYTKNHKDPGSPEYYMKQHEMMEGFTKYIDAHEIYAKYYEK